MMNYIALNTVSFLLNGPMKDKSPEPVIARTPDCAEPAFRPSLQGSVCIGVLFSLWSALFLIWWLLKKTTLGLKSAPSA